MTDRAAFLAEVRDRLRDGIPVNLLRPVADMPLGDPIAYAVDLSDPVAAFVDAASRVSAEVIDRGGDLEELLARVVVEEGIRRAVVSEDPECQSAAAILSDRGVEVLPIGVAGSAESQLGITGALAGVALTGSLVVDAGRAATRVASLLPEIHLAIVRRETIVPTIGHILRDLPRWLPNGLPSSLVVITGPSRSADIELELTIGVHGPRRLLIALR